MLQQILNDMFIDPDLLAELDDQQKQTLFCKMRAEQVQRWKKREEQLELEEAEKPNVKKKNSKKKVEFLLGKDDQPWTWVMGENDEENCDDQFVMVQSQLEKFRLKSSENTNLAVKSNSRPKPPVPPKDKVLERLAYLRHKQDADNNDDDESKDIYEKIRETQRNADQLSEMILKEQEDMWKEREKKAKEAERRIREIARQAREEHLKTTNSLRSQMNASVRQKRCAAFAFSDRMNKRRPNKPSDRSAVVDWFRNHEVPKIGSAIDPETQQPIAWFHGFISRNEAEQLLDNYVPGTFLVRLSERIWGYAISLRSADRCKHFLVDAAGSTYQFFGAGHLAHSTLSELILHHKISPITSTGQELLLYPCPRDVKMSNMQQLFT